MSLGRYFRRRAWDEERRGELEAHLAQEIEDNVARGMAPEEARRRAYLKLGNPTAIREEIWKMNSFVSVEELGRDLRYAVRQLMHNPGFAAIAIVTLALGIGVNTAIFSMVNGLLYRSLHIENERQVLKVGFRQNGANWQKTLSLPEYQALTAQTRGVFSDVFCEVYGLDGLRTEGNLPDRVFTDYVSGSYFEGLGVKPALGRLFRPTEGVTPGADPYVVLSYAYWKEYFGGDRKIVGRQIALDSKPVTVVGVAPQSFRGLSSILGIQAYLPLAMTVTIENTPLADFNKQSFRSLQVYGRLRNRVTRQDAGAALAVVARDLARAHPVDDRNAKLRGFPVETGMVTGSLDQDKSLVMIASIFLSLAGLVLMLACVNVANLLLVRATVREREMVIRSALGAARFRLIRQMLTESVLLALLGGMGGIALGLAGSTFLSSINLQTDLPIAFDFGFDWHVFAFSAAIAVAAGALVGIVPAVRLARANLNLVLREGGRGIAGRGHKLRDGLVTVQVSAALTLLVIAGLFMRSLERSAHANLGFNPDHVVTMMMDPGEIGYNVDRSLAFYKDLLPRMRSLPGVVSATVAQSIPMGMLDNGTDAVIIEGYTPPAGQAAPEISNNIIGTDYFETLQIPLLEGRLFSDSDKAQSRYVAIVSEAMAKKYWPHEDPIGRRFTMLSEPIHPLQIVGVAGDAQYETPEGAAPSYFYTPYAQHDLNSLLALEVRTEGDPGAMGPAIERAIHAQTPGLPLFDVKTLHQALYSPNGLLLYEVVAALAGVMGMLGLVLAVVGVYGVLSYVVSQKTGEIGVRMALGAQRGDILRMVYRQGLWIVGIGLAVGLAASFGAAHLLRSMITVSTMDPVTFVVVTALLGAIALLACYVPARRAMRVEPMQALRME
ncbi:MAG TPA: ABC transporter permease [Acidobacteriaceae bacterium]|jgi:predicted permease|nr:ABC transporter permease [Acidobacteriaceae bacterium]